MINAELLREKIIGPLPLGHFYPELTKRGAGLRHGDDAARGDRALGGVHQARFYEARFKETDCLNSLSDRNAVQDQESAADTSARTKG